jgi:hypothetical protein
MGGYPETIWQKCHLPFFPRRMMDGRWTTSAGGQVWRRKRQDGKWEYQQDEETVEEWLDRQW